VLSFDLKFINEQEQNNLDSLIEDASKLLNMYCVKLSADSNS
jgi:hypothetical protein